jgi:hypothetical protein
MRERGEGNKMSVGAKKGKEEKKKDRLARLVYNGA